MKTDKRRTFKTSTSRQDGYRERKKKSSVVQVDEMRKYVGYKNKQSVTTFNKLRFGKFLQILLSLEIEPKRLNVIDGPTKLIPDPEH